MNRIFTFLLVVVTVSAYANTLGNDFVAGDREFLVRNPAIAEPQTVITSFVSDYWGTLGGESFVYYRPLIILSHFIDARLYGLDAAGHHLSNLIVHVIITVLFFRLLLCLYPFRFQAAFAGAALFALHPVHTHSVSYIMGRTDMLAALFYTAGFILLAGTVPTRKKTALACLCYFLALLCKEIAVTLPAAYLLYRLFWQRSSRKVFFSAVLLPVLCLGVTAALYLLMRAHALQGVDPQDILPAWYTPWQHLLLVIISAGFYIGKLVLPLKLCYYGNIIMPAALGEASADPLFWVALVFAGLCLVCLKYFPRMGFALAWTGVSLAPVLNIIPLPSLVKENYLYIPSMGFCLLFTMGAVRVPYRFRSAAWGVVVLLALLYAAGTLSRNKDYRDPVVFLQRTREAMQPIPAARRGNPLYLEGVKNFYTLYKNLGRLYMERRQWSEAAAAFEQALSYSTPFPPDYSAHLQVSLGTLYEEMGQPDRAARILTEALPVTGRPQYVNNLLGVIAAQKHDLERAEHYFKQAVACREDYAPAYFNLGKLYVQRGMLAEAREALETAARLDPKYGRYTFEGRGQRAEGGALD